MPVSRPFVSIAIAVALAAVQARAADKTLKCDAAKLGAAAKYAACRLKADAKATKSGGSPAADHAKCEAKFLKTFDRIESKAGAGTCSVDGNAAALGSCLERVTVECMPLAAGCDGRGDCTACYDCAFAAGSCSPEADACTASPDCQAFGECLTSCTDDTCVDQCVTDHPTGAALLLAFQTCIFCTHCPVDCATVPTCS
jgi:hypothetical protein